MSDHQPDRKQSGFKETTRVAAAREQLQEVVAGHDRTESVPLLDADDRVLAEEIVAPRNVPHYSQAAMDGYAVRARDTFGASGRSPEALRRAEEMGPGAAVRVHTGSEVPAGADAIVMIEQTDEFGTDIEVFDAVAEGENVAPVGEDVERGQSLYEQGHRLRPSDLGMLKSVGVREVTVYEPPRIAVIPTGEELVQTDPDPGEVVETNGLTVSRFVERWGGDATYHDVVTDDETALREAIESNLDHDIVVTTGGSSVGKRDLLPEVVDSIGEVIVHGVALKPGHPVALGIIEHDTMASENSENSEDSDPDGEETPIVMLPGYPVACIINAVQFVRPALKWTGNLPLDDFPTTDALLERKIRSEPGIRSFVRVTVNEDGEERSATPTRTSGSGILSSVALADGWVEVPEEREGIPAGETVAVGNWEWSA
ncbi:MULTISPECIES: gephyrin-like molybdotransferase Glp [unclassified Haladaptatus]|uniref:molybdopterin molybdotransferase MoeA n=1 Tax=unclassified Haladaptatus TaxID=2622732 RepID=UPI00209BE712|nr:MULTISPECIES: gephyrin-like molybdotransferase Glp [unclassified Haladaptatus]MCO8245144.1 molybdopterin molybdotransferase MoeA [Haladaptatus sp. AB643]MCO8253287.1 molybdopterin molybdotransferase MoeA [Haladaptatus sp. AB618]